MQIIALIGKSGTGKSHKAQLVARENDISYIIDDGLFISGIEVLAGSSAKRESTKISAIRRAIFQDPEHAREVKGKIDTVAPDKILILGTSESMIVAICEALGLPLPKIKFNIDDISTSREITIARQSRKFEGKHVIPVPTFEIKKDFSGFFLDPLRIFYRQDKQIPIVEEKSVVRPTYSYMGKYSISDTTVRQIIIHCARQVPGVAHSGIRVLLNSYSTGIAVKIEITVEMSHHLYEVLERVQRQVADVVEHMTALNVIKVDVLAKKISLK